MAALQIATTPALTGVRFTFDGTPMSTGADGTARTTVAAGATRHTVSLLDLQVTNGEEQARFVRWWGQPRHRGDYHSTFTNLIVRRNTKLQAAFRVSRLVRYDFVDQGNEPVPSPRIATAVLRSDTGQRISLHGGRVRLLSARPSQGQGSLLVRESLYSLESVVIDGANVVNVNEQRFRPAQKTQVRFVVQLRTIRIQAHDALLGAAYGRAVSLVYPDGRRQRITMGATRTVSMSNLARGNYQVAVEGPGFTFVRAVSLSRSQNIDLPVVTYWDTVIVGLFLLSAAVGFLLVGRYRRRARPVPVSETERAARPEVEAVG